MANDSDNLVALIPAGGAGTRLWPLSTRSHPKFLSDLSGAGTSLLAQTRDRLAELTGEHGILIITGQAHAEAVRAELAIDDRQVICEPSGRDSLPAIALGAAIAYVRCEREQGTAGADQLVVGSFAADHIIADEQAFRAAVRTAMAAARAGYITTIGITPDHPATGFGYIRRAQCLQGVPGAFECAEFVEKPDSHRAREYLADGDYLWNAGMFVMSAKVMLDHLRRLMPDDYQRIMALAQAWDSDARNQTIAEHWEQITKIAIDHAIAEPVAADGGVAVVPADFGWNDVGDYLSLAEVNPTGADQVVQLAVGEPTRVLALNSPGAMVASRLDAGHGKAVVIADCPDIVVVQTSTTIFVTRTDRAQQVKQVVDRLDEAGMSDLR